MKAKKAFTLLEVLVAFAILSIGLTLLAAAIGRHFAALQILETSLSAQQAARAQMLREIARRGDEVEIPADLIEERFNPTLDVVPVAWETEPLRQLEMERVTSGVSWAVRHQLRQLQVTAGFPKPPASEQEAP